MTKKSKTPKLGPKKVQEIVDNVIKNMSGKYCHLDGECKLAGELKNTRFCAPCSLYRK